MQSTPNPGQPSHRLPPHRVQPLPGRHAYQVQMEPETEPHIVNRLPAMVGLTYAACTCSEADDADCSHTQAVEAYLEERRRQAAWRRDRGLTYSGVRLAIVPDLKPGSWMTEPYVEVWEGDTSQILEAGPSQELFNHSPDGFEWGYEGSGPSQLALAILLDFTGDHEVSLLLYHRFKKTFIAPLPQNSGHAWKITGEEIEAFLQQYSWQAPSLDVPVGNGEPSAEAASRSEKAFDGEELEFSRYSGALSRCRVYCRRHRGRSVVLVSDVPHSRGASVTNRIEEVAGLVCRHFRIEPRRLVLIQYHPRSAASGESFELVSFRHIGIAFEHPQWTGLTRHQVASLLGCGVPV